MKTIILFFIFFPFVLYGECSTDSTKLYEDAKNETEGLKKILLLEKAKERCNAPEITMSLFMLKAENSNSSKEKIIYYKKAIGTLDGFSNKEERSLYLKAFTQKLTELYQPIDKGVSDYYKQMSDHIIKKEHSHLWFYILVLLLFSWGLWGIKK